MAKPVIGLDFGNYNSFTCYISNFNEGTKMGGIVYDLVPPELKNGIPSVFFHSKKIGTLCGEDAVRNRAKPVENRKRYLKRHLGDTMTLDDGNTTISYDVAITEVIQHCVRKANEQLKSRFQVTTNLISLSYPASYTFAQRQRLIELAEKATLTDGTKVKVYGTIAEPAAAALDYLAESSKSTKETTVLVYDLGGGTFDLALVSAYPAGKRNSSGDLYYYDVIDKGGLANVGGTDFDKKMYDLLVEKINVPLKPIHKNTLRDQVEDVKIDLSSDEYAEVRLVYNEEYLPVQVTRSEFENASKDLLMKTINATKEILDNHPNQQPEFILLTGGASKMPMVKKELEAQIPNFKGKIKYFRPSQAIAYGAARFGTSEANTDPVRKTSIVQQRTTYDLGIRLYRYNSDEVFVSTYIKAGTPIPYTGDYDMSVTRLEKQRYSTFSVYEAIKAHPDENKVNEDYREIMSVELDHEIDVPKGTKCESRLMVDKLGILTIEARDVDKPGKPPIKKNYKLKNLS